MHELLYCVHMQSSLSYPEGKPSMLHHVINHGLVDQVGKSFSIADEFMIHVFKAHLHPEGTAASSIFDCTQGLCMQTPSELKKAHTLSD